MIENNNKEKCCGCGACQAVCPQQCIVMMKDNEGFYYPEVSYEKCIKCGLCKKVCPFYESFHFSNSIKAYAAKNRDFEIRYNSSSGGVFSALGEKVIKKGGVVYGASLDSNCKSVQHKAVWNINKISLLRGSKYVQSKPLQIYGEIEEYLKNDILVLFSGTPCQVNALKNYLNKQYTNLICVDVVCHGVPSQKLWEIYINNIEKSYFEKVNSVNFRNKKRGWHNFGIQIEFESGRKIFKSKEKDPFLIMFLRNYSLRPACYSCVPKKNSMADLSLADFWGISNVLPEIYDEIGVSLILVRNENGKKILEEIKAELCIEEVDVKNAIAYNSIEYLSVKRPKLRNEFYFDLNEMAFKELRKKYGKPDYRRIIKNKLANSLLWKCLKKCRKSIFNNI